MPSSQKKSCAYPGCPELVTFGYCDKHRKHSYYPSLKRPPRIRVIMVVGAPGSGKSYYVAQNAKPGDIVLDLDEIQSEISGKPLHSYYSHEIMEKAIQVRNQRIEDLENVVLPGKTLWFIVSAGNTIDRMRWKQILQPVKTYVMNCPLNICIQRIRERRSESETDQILAAEKWFKNFEPLTTDFYIDTGGK